MPIATIIAWMTDKEERPTDLFHQHNLAIPMAYFSVGMVSSLIATPLNIYMVEHLNAEPSMQNTIGILQTLPWSLKMVYGFLSDAVPIYGLHRKPYLLLGSLLYSFAFLTYSLAGIHNVVFLATCVFAGTLGLIQMDVMADTMCVERSKYEAEENKGQMQATCYSVRFTGSVLGAVIGALVSNSKSWGWGLSFVQVSFLNGVVPLLLVTPFLWILRERYHKVKHHKPVASSGTDSPVSSPAISSSQPLTHSLSASSAISHKQQATSEKTPLMPSTTEEVIEFGDANLTEVELVRRLDKKHSLTRNNSNSVNGPSEQSPLFKANQIKRYKSFWTIEVEEVDSTIGIRQQLQEIWETVQLQAVWRPMAFVYIYNVLQIPNVAWQSFLQLTLDFPSWVLGLSVLLGSVMTLTGILVYKNYFFKSSWRSIYVGTTALITFFSLLQLILIFQINKTYLHMSNYFFSLGDDVISAYINGIQFLPVCIMYMRLCPDGAEGASYSMLTTFSNVAFVVSSDIGNYLTRIWDVSNDSLRAHDISGLWRLSLFTSCVSITPLVLLFLLPRDAQDQDDLAKSQYRSKFGGFVFLSVLFASLGWSIYSAIAELLVQQ